MFLGWYDPDKKIPARYKLEDALERYARKFGRPAQTCITSPEDAAELEADKEAPSMPVRGVGFIPRYTFYVGMDEEAEEVVRPVAGNAPGKGERKSVRRKVAIVASGSEETTAVVKPRRRNVAKTTPAPDPKPVAKRTVMDPVPVHKPAARRAKTTTEVKPEEPRLKSDQVATGGANRKTADPGAKPANTRAKTDPAVKPGTKRPKSDPGANPGTKRPTTDSSAKSATVRPKSDLSVKPATKRVEKEQEVKPGAKRATTDHRVVSETRRSKTDNMASVTKPAKRGPGSKPGAKPTKVLRD